jgi:hypothetical protein
MNNIESVYQRISREVLDKWEITEEKDSLDARILQYGMDVKNAMDNQGVILTLEEILTGIRIALRDELEERLYSEEKWDTDQVKQKMKSLGLVD